jgi:hypothetical protein
VPCPENKLKKFRLQGLKPNSFHGLHAGAESPGLLKKKSRNFWDDTLAVGSAVRAY